MVLARFTFFATWLTFGGDRGVLIDPLAWCSLTWFPGFGLTNMRSIRRRSLATVMV